MASTVKVWDRPVRLFHWSLAGSVALCWLTADELQSLHEVAGSAAAALIGLRLVLGVAGTRYARFSQFIRSPKQILLYAGDLLRHKEPRYLGHNPLGAAMVGVLLSMVGGIAFTGWMQTTDAYWGVESALGETLSYVNTEFRVSLIYEDLPAESHLRHEALISFNALPNSADIDVLQDLWNVSTFTYVMLPKDFQIGEFNTISDSFWNRYMADRGEEAQSRFSFHLEELSKQLTLGDLSIRELINEGRRY